MEELPRIVFSGGRAVLHKADGSPPKIVPVGTVVDEAKLDELRQMLRDLPEIDNASGPEQGD